MRAHRGARVLAHALTPAGACLRTSARALRMRTGARRVRAHGHRRSPSDALTTSWRAAMRARTRERIARTRGLLVLSTFVLSSLLVCCPLTQPQLSRRGAPAAGLTRG